MNRQGKLELTWAGKEEDVRPEPRILLEDESLSYGEGDRDNLLIHGDNLLALRSLEREYEGKVKCVYIDPPYNTGAAFAQYDDGLEHSEWLSMMKPRLELLRRLLSEDGTIWISIDDDEQAYLKVLCDEIFGRHNFVANVIWEKRYAPTNDSKWLSDSHDFILVYGKDKERWRPNLLPRGEKQNRYYRYDDKDGRGPWRSDNVLVKSFSPSGVFPIVNPNTGKEYYPPEGSCYRFSRQTAERYLKEGRFYFGKDGRGAPQLKRYLSEVKQGVTPMTIWKREEVSDNQEAKKEARRFQSDAFATPKPERLIERILYLATDEGDLVLDSFLGSGTTAAVAHKMRRRWIGVEMGDHCRTHCLPRLRQVVDGEQGGISIEAGWRGGGGFRYCELAGPFLVRNDLLPIWQVNPDFTEEMAAKAVCALEGFCYEPKGDYQGLASEQRFVHVTFQYVNAAYVAALTRGLKAESGQSLIIYCIRMQRDMDLPDWVTVRRLPGDLPDKYEFESGVEG